MQYLSKAFCRPSFCNLLINIYRSKIRLYLLNSISRSPSMWQKLLSKLQNGTPATAGSPERSAWPPILETSVAFILEARQGSSPIHKSGVRKHNIRNLESVTAGYWGIWWASGSDRRTGRDVITSQAGQHDGHVDASAPHVAWNVCFKHYTTFFFHAYFHFLSSNGHHHQ